LSKIDTPRATRFAAGLFTEVGGDVVAFGVEEGANSHLPPGIHVTAHDKLRLFCGIFALPPEFHLTIATLCGRILASALSHMKPTLQNTPCTKRSPTATKTPRYFIDSHHPFTPKGALLKTIGETLGNNQFSQIIIYEN
jgi:hypothetical protein